MLLCFFQLFQKSRAKTGNSTSSGIHISHRVLTLGQVTAFFARYPNTSGNHWNP